MAGFLCTYHWLNRKPFSWGKKIRVHLGKFFGQLKSRGCFTWNIHRMHHSVNSLKQAASYGKRNLKIRILWRMDRNVSIVRVVECIVKRQFGISSVALGFVIERQCDWRARSTSQWHLLWKNLFTNSRSHYSSRILLVNLLSRLSSMIGFLFFFFVSLSQLEPIEVSFNPYYRVAAAT